ncbi:MAG TPA: hypothetical protein VGM94_03825 [Galbitalea sp.]|jgi:hypothetical protein
MTVVALRDFIGLTAARAWLSGGCALDLWLGQPSRAHEDIDVSVLSEDWRLVVESLPSWIGLFAAEKGQLWPIDASEQPPPSNTWCEDVRTGEMVLQINAETGSESCWIYRRNSAVTLPWSDALSEVDGLPIVAPAVQMLWKSKSPGAKDESDWDVVIPKLGLDQRRWLSASIRVAHPESPWAQRLP